MRRLAKSKAPAEACEETGGEAPSRLSRLEQKLLRRRKVRPAQNRQLPKIVQSGFARITTAFLLLTGCSHMLHPRLIVLGVDGMDPGFVERHWSELPNLRSIRDRGSFSRLATTTPPQSPVAWSTFSTGLDPVEHGLFDFVHRDPSTMQPISSFAEVLPPKHELGIGPYLLPISGAEVRSFRRGRTFWELLARNGVPATVVRMPANYPPPSRGGEQLAGMGTPDLEGTFGTFTFYSDDPLEIERSVPGGRIVPIHVEGGRAILPVAGPANPLRRDRAPTNVDVVLDIDGPAARLTVQGRHWILKEGEWSPWIRVRIALIPYLASTSGMFRLYAKQLAGGVRVYRTPLNLDPAQPALPISSPKRFSRDLSSRIGAFYTQGIEEDTAALRQSVFTMAEYLEQSRMVHQEHVAMLRDALDRYREGLLFFYFSEIDQNSHMLWGKHEPELLATYQEVDRSIGAVIAQARGAEIIVMSDHGFAPFDTAVDLNGWLRRQGFLVTNKTGIDWSRTRAYAMGLNALYVNLAGREEHGIVHAGAERDGLLADLTRRLDAEKPAIERVSRLPANADRYAPDLIVGYARGYRASWETALGEVGNEVFTPNEDAWIADHCIAADQVPGTLVTTRRVRLGYPALKDLTVTILQYFDIPSEPAMKGRSIY